jgi:hypothetical protein
MFARRQAGVFLKMLRAQWLGNHVPAAEPFARSINWHRCEQNGPYAPANQSPFFLHVGQMTFVPRSLIH